MFTYFFNKRTPVESEVADKFSEGFGQDPLEISANILTMQTESTTPQESHQQHLWNERARIRRLWLNFNYGESRDKFQNAIVQTINPDNPQR